ncbi:hypothetical protein [Wolbachia endosymbiont of Oedothorax gibbosus]|uniref:hypothetical protein n=1 Tax=Wolbachia endosymbiont of Oedothorax gibbosus TaxID=931100 RepID=UPI0020249DFA|nr:hypothetical protein [Wolbachia endosymbiont of Oedothorax gibbosus]
MTELTGIQQQIKTSLITAIGNNNPQMVQDIFEDEDNDYGDIQAVLSHKGTVDSNLDAILDFAIRFEAQGEFEKSVEIIKLIWEEADQATRDSVCCRAMDSFQEYGDNYIITTLKEGQKLYVKKDIADGKSLEDLIKEVEDYKRVMDLDMALRHAIRSLDVDQVKTALENCGTNVERVLMRNVYWNNSTNIDCLLIYPLLVNYGRELNQEDVEKIKEIFELMFNAASPQLLEFELNGNNYVMDKLTCAQKLFAEIPGVGEQCFQDLIRALEEKLSEHASKKLIEEQAREDAERLQNEGQNTFISSINTTIPEKNETTFWSEHKGKIALGVTGLCVAGAVAAYVLAYPVVALALTVLAAVILMGAGIAKFCEKSESPDTKSSDPVVSGCCNNAELPNQ